MAQLEVRLETVTPLFLGGSDPRGAPELRAASFRGVLRFWLRALLGGVLGDRNLDDLRKAEAAVFGSTDAASPVVVRLAGDDQAGAFRPLLHNPQKTFTLQGIRPGQQLTLTLAARPPDSFISDAAYAALLIFVLLGGLGKRSRRGFGSFIIRPGSENHPFSVPDYTNTDHFAEQLPLLIQEAREKTKSLVQKLGLASRVPNDPPQFPIIHERYCKVLFCKNQFNSWEGAMKDFWGLLRSNKYKDNPVFGFAGKAGRQGSPLHVRIVRINDKYHLLCSAFKLRFEKAQPSWNIMEQFLEECCQRWNGSWAFGGSSTW